MFSAPSDKLRLDEGTRRPRPARQRAGELGPQPSSRRSQAGDLGALTRNTESVCHYLGPAPFIVSAHQPIATTLQRARPWAAEPSAPALPAGPCSMTVTRSGPKGRSGSLLPPQEERPHFGLRDVKRVALSTAAREAVPEEGLGQAGGAPGRLSCTQSSSVFLRLICLDLIRFPISERDDFSGPCQL